MTAASDQAALLAALADGKMHTSRELYQLNLNLGFTVDELRRQGHDIRSWREWERRFGRPEPITYYLLAASPLEAGETKADNSPGSRQGSWFHARTPVGTASPASSGEPCEPAGSSAGADPSSQGTDGNQPSPLNSQVAA